MDLSFSVCHRRVGKLEVKDQREWETREAGYRSGPPLPTVREVESAPCESQGAMMAYDVTIGALLVTPWILIGVVFFGAKVVSVGRWLRRHKIRQTNRAAL